ncbi:glycosyltransferase family 2 protein [Actinomadura litoris]|uniref:Glycosyltransferase n=1 Tax=Actinomadura litoris TaxID=2678616 RepID=A0A7K1KX74_9ACTN|nr:glycosyltransferase family A protein [Actinomadura litoris]MUN36800.1 glycosyltransferase [Actinomadura litoris]
MADLKISVVIPYKQRLDNIRSVLGSLADQTMDADEFEVVVGAMEYSEEYVAACREFTGSLNLVSVLSDDEWNVAQARNLAIRQATGRVIMLLDADMVLPPQVLDTLYDGYFAGHRNVCVLGKALGYSCVVEHAPNGTELTMSGQDNSGVLAYGGHRALLDDLEQAGEVWADDRKVLESVPLPWSLVWTGLVALPAETVRRHDLMFDENFRGWGSEDQEWGYRVYATGTPLVLGDDVYGMHLPHDRDAATDQESYRANSRYFLTKWPTLDVEITRAYGWEDGNRLYPEVRDEVAAAVSGHGRTLGVVRGKAEGTDLLVVGAEIDSRTRVPAPDVSDLFDDADSLDVLPLLGLALPFGDGDLGECRVLPSVLGLGERHRDTVLAEAGRVSAGAVASPLETA